MRISLLIAGFTSYYHDCVAGVTGLMNCGSCCSEVSLSKITSITHDFRHVTASGLTPGD